MVRSRHKQATVARSCHTKRRDSIEIVNAVDSANVEAVKMVVGSRVPVQRFVQHKQGLRVDPHCGDMNHECHHVRGKGGMADWDDAEDAEAQEEFVGSLE